MRTVGQIMSTCRQSPSGSAAVLFALARHRGPLAAAEERLCDMPPFDQIVLDEINKNAVLNVEPLELPGAQGCRRSRRACSRFASLRIRPGRSKSRGKTFARCCSSRMSCWRRPSGLRGEKKFDDAFDYYARLLREYPTMPGLERSGQRLSSPQCLQLIETQQFDRALAVLTTLYERQPHAPGLLAAVDAVCGKLIEQQLRDKDYSGARAVLDMWQDQFSALNSPTAAAWQQRFAAAAERQLNDARQHSGERNTSQLARRSAGPATSGPSMQTGRPTARRDYSGRIRRYRSACSRRHPQTRPPHRRLGVAPRQPAARADDHRNRGLRF